jgi:hypothetical protein
VKWNEVIVIQLENEERSKTADREMRCQQSNPGCQQRAVGVVLYRSDNEAEANRGAGASKCQAVSSVECQV